MKIHLEYLGGMLICGTRNVKPENKTQKLDKATCGRCLNSYTSNTQYYKKFFDVEELNSKITIDTTKMKENLAVVRGAMDIARANRLRLEGYCLNCGRKIRVIAYTGTNYCSENCRKDLLTKEKS